LNPANINIEVRTHPYRTVGFVSKSYIARAALNPWYRALFTTVSTVSTAPVPPVHESTEYSLHGRYGCAFQLSLQFTRFSSSLLLTARPVSGGESTAHLCVPCRLMPPKLCFPCDHRRLGHRQARV